MKPLFFAQALLCALIALRLLFFQRDGASHRPWAARLAYLLIVLAGTAVIGVLFARYEWALVAQVGLTFILCVAVFAVRGNVVELFRMGAGEGSWLLRFLRRSGHDHPAAR